MVRTASFILADIWAVCNCYNKAGWRDRQCGLHSLFVKTLNKLQFVFFCLSKECQKCPICVYQEWIFVYKHLRKLPSCSTDQQIDREELLTFPKNLICCSWGIFSPFLLVATSEWIPGKQDDIRIQFAEWSRELKLPLQTSLDLLWKCSQLSFYYAYFIFRRNQKTSAV